MESLITKIRKTKRKPCVSIIVPVFNGSETISCCLDSIISGTNVFYELICVDDGSTDETLSILKKYAARNKNIRIIRHDNNRGLFATRITGVENANGEYIGFVDADDCIGAGYFDHLYQAGGAQQADIAVGSIVNQTSDGERYIQTRCYKFPYTTNSINQSLYNEFWNQEGKCYHWHVIWNKIYKRELWQNRLEYLQNINCRLTMLEDFVFSSIILSSVQSYAVCTEALYYYIDSENASTKDLDDFEKLTKKIREMINAFDIVKTFLLDNNMYGKYGCHFEEWRQRYCRYWKKNILQSSMTDEDMFESINDLQKWAGKTIMSISYEDIYYYEQSTIIE